jgi:hypothetical protein
MSLWPRLIFSVKNYSALKTPVTSSNECVEGSSNKYFPIYNGRFFFWRLVCVYGTLESVKTKGSDTIYHGLYIVKNQNKYNIIGVLRFLQKLQNTIFGNLLRYRAPFKNRLESRKYHPNFFSFLFLKLDLRPCAELHP